MASPALIAVLNKDNTIKFSSVERSNCDQSPESVDHFESYYVVISIQRLLTYLKAVM
jgi:hypothetical protein